MVKSLFTNPKIRHILLFNAVFAGIFLSLHLFHHPFSILSVKEHSDGRTILNMLYWYDAETAHEYINGYKMEALHIYNRITLLDMVVIIPSYVFLTVQASFYFLRRSDSGKKLFYATLTVVLVAAVANYGQDMIIRRLLFLRPGTDEFLAGLSGWLSMVKFTALGSCPLILFVFWLKQKR